MVKEDADGRMKTVSRIWRKKKDFDRGIEVMK